MADVFFMESVTKTGRRKMSISIDVKVLLKNIRIHAKYFFDTLSSATFLGKELEMGEVSFFFTLTASKPQNKKMVIKTSEFIGGA